MSCRPIGQIVFARKLEARFAWKAPAARRVLKALTKTGFVRRSSRRSGRYLDGFSYEIVDPRPNCGNGR
jgi:hypothetical protein